MQTAHEPLSPFDPSAEKRVMTWLTCGTSYPTSGPVTLRRRPATHEHDDQHPRLDRMLEPAAVGDDRGREGRHRITQRTGLRDQTGEHVRSRV
jgi:hypothetical protein